jgi:ABC-type transporter Mla subunit MlaD
VQPTSENDSVLGPDHSEIGVLLNNLAVMHRQAGQLDEALSHYVRALPLLQRTLGEQHPTVVTCAENLSALTYDTARRAVAPNDPE